MGMRGLDNSKELGHQSTAGLARETSLLDTKAHVLSAPAGTPPGLLAQDSGLALAVLNTESHNERTVASLNKWLLTDPIPATPLAVRKPGDYMDHTGSSSNTGCGFEQDHMDAGSWELGKALGGYRTWREGMKRLGFRSVKKTGSNSMMTLRYGKVNSAGLHSESVMCTWLDDRCTELETLTLERT